VAPTDRLIRLFAEYGAKLTIMADVAEILKFKEYSEKSGRDDYHYESICAQLRRAIKSGHDVQLHIHSAYFNARHDGVRWLQDWSEYDFARLPYERMSWMVKTCKDFLETLLTPADPSYRCHVFRAANWSVSPSKNVVRALVANGIEIDTSVFKYGRRDSRVRFDYSHAHSHATPWRVKEDDICVSDVNGSLWESPIYSERRWIGAFVTPSRIYRAYLSWRHNVARERDGDVESQEGTCPQSRWPITSLLRRHAWKADFNQCSARQLIRALRRVRGQRFDKDAPSAFVLIGHSKLLTEGSVRRLRPFLEFIRTGKRHYKFATFGDLALGSSSGTPSESDRGLIIR
jgi:hypothetical protein